MDREQFDDADEFEARERLAQSQRLIEEAERDLQAIRQAMRGLPAAPVPPESQPDPAAQPRPRSLGRRLRKLAGG